MYERMLLILETQVAHLHIRIQTHFLSAAEGHIATHYLTLQLRMLRIFPCIMC